MGEDGVDKRRHSERCIDLLEAELEDGVIGTEYVSADSPGGALGSMVKLFTGSVVVERLGDYARDLKAFCEKEALKKT